MSQQQQQQQQQQAALPEKDMLYTILCELKRTSREYTTAATESNCSIIRQVFTSLLHSTLQTQEKVYQCMKQQNIYKASSPALRQEADKQFRQHQQSQQELNQFVQSKLQGQGQQSSGAASAFAYNGNGSSQYQPYMM
jgi:spore coat protein F